MKESRIDQRIIDLWDDYVHVHFNRRLFLKQAAGLLGSTVAAAALLPALASNSARAAVVAENDPRLRTERLQVAGASGPLKTYLASPVAPVRIRGRPASILVVHQKRGLTPYIEDITRRLAVVGYAAIAVDFLSPLGGTPADKEAAIQLSSKLDLAKVTADAHAAIAFMRKRGDPNGRAGALGFSWGGGVVNRVAAEPARMHGANIDAGVVYYGAPPPLDQVAKIKAALLLNYADPKLDTRLGGLLPGYEEALKAAKVRYTLYVYAGANHAFNDDTQSAHYDEAAASLAWERTLGFFKDHLL
ncbi:MAG TPA: dienelactone hydrolase family protein [Methylovirgula sp.]